MAILKAIIINALYLETSKVRNLCTKSHKNPSSGQKSQNNKMANNYKLSLKMVENKVQLTICLAFEVK